MGDKVIVDLSGKVVLDIIEYCDKINELDFLRSLMIEFYLNEIDKNKFQDEIKKANKKYHWWA